MARPRSSQEVFVFRHHSTPPHQGLPQVEWRSSPTQLSIPLSFFTPPIAGRGVRNNSACNIYEVDVMPSSSIAKIVCSSSPRFFSSMSPNTIHTVASDFSVNHRLHRRQLIHRTLNGEFLNPSNGGNGGDVVVAVWVALLL